MKYYQFFDHLSCFFLILECLNGKRKLSETFWEMTKSVFVGCRRFFSKLISLGAERSKVETNFWKAVYEKLLHVNMQSCPSVLSLRTESVRPLIILCNVLFICIPTFSLSFLFSLFVLIFFFSLHIFSFHVACSSSICFPAHPPLTLSTFLKPPPHLSIFPTFLFSLFSLYIYIFFFYISALLKCWGWTFWPRFSSSPSCCRATVAGRRTFQRTLHQSSPSDCTTNCRRRGVRKTSFFRLWVWRFPWAWWSWEPEGPHWKRYDRLWDSAACFLVGRTYRFANIREKCLKKEATTTAAWYLIIAALSYVAQTSDFSFISLFFPFFLFKNVWKLFLNLFCS